MAAEVMGSLSSSLAHRAVKMGCNAKNGCAFAAGITACASYWKLAATKAERNTESAIRPHCDVVKDKGNGAEG